MERQKLTINGNKEFHNKTNTRLYSIYQNMIGRCCRKYNDNYKNYGDRGITVCIDWLDSFETFYNWSVENGYSNTLTLDRKNVNGNYEPNNCRWITIADQQDNKQNTIYYTYKGKTKTLTQWAKITGIERATLMYRIKNGFSEDKVFKEPPRKRAAFYQGKFISLKEYAKLTGTPYNTVQTWFTKGYFGNYYL
jgi:hypothetical protein